MTAIVSAPVVISPSQWLPSIWGGFEPEFESEQEFERVFSLLVRYMNGVNAFLMNAPQDYEPVFLEREHNNQIFTIVDDWCEGYMRGVMSTQEQWRLESKHMSSLLAPIKAFTIDYGTEDLNRLSPEEIRKLQNAIVENTRAIFAHWREMPDSPAKGQPDDSANIFSDSFQIGRQQPFYHDAPKVGRNDPCPCGSGKKFKKCCLH